MKQIDPTNDSRHMTMNQRAAITVILAHEIRQLKEIEEQKNNCAYSTELTNQLNVVNFLARLLAFPVVLPGPNGNPYAGL